MFNPNAPHRRPSHSLNTPVPILIDSDEEISDAEHESENESGSENDSMQVDEYPQREMGNYNLAGLDPTMQFSPADPRVRGRRHLHHHHHPHHQHGTYHTSIEQEKKVRSRLREERHAALCVLMDRELLTIQALAAQETLPQARRRFLSKLMAPEDVDIAASIRADRFTIIQPSTANTTSSTSSAQKRHRPSSPSASQSFVTSSSSAGPVTVHRKIVDVYGVDDDGWKKPDPILNSTSGSRSGRGGRVSSGSASPAPSSAASVRRERGRENVNATPKGRAVSGSASSSASRRLQREREREVGRRRREDVDDYDDHEGVF